MMEREYNDMNRYPRPEQTPPESFGKCSKKPRGVRFWIGFTLAFMTFVPLWAYCLYRAITQLPAEQQLLAGILMLASAIFSFGVALMAGFHIETIE